MKRRTIWMIGISLTVVAAMAFIIAGCGGSKAPSAKSDSNFGSNRTGEIVLTVDWGKSRVIPPSTVRVDVTIMGDGLVNPFQDSITRPSGQTSVTKVYTLPVGFKHVTAEAKDSNNQTVAAGSGTATLSEGQRTNLEIVMSEITARTILVQTYRGKQQAPPDFIAFRDGDGPWQRIEPTIAPQYTLTIRAPDGRYGLAIVFVRPSEVTEVEVNIIHATVNELSQINWVSEEAPPATTVTVSGTVSGLGSDEAALIAMGGAQVSVYPPYNTYSLYVPPGTYDLVAIKGSTQVWPPVGNKMLIQRNVVVSGNTTINIDFNDPEAFVPETHNAVIDGIVSGEVAGGEAFFISHNGTRVWTGGKFEVPPPTIQFPFASVPTNKQFGNDIHYLSAIAMTDTTTRLIERYFKAPTDISVTLPSPFGNASVTVAATNPYARFTARWDAYSGAQAYFARFGEGGGIDLRRRLVSNPQPSRPKKRSRQAIYRRWFVGLSAGWLGRQTSYTLPDLSGVSGWDNNWGFPASGSVPWEVGAVATNRTIQDFVNVELTPIDGLEVRGAGKRGTATH